MYQKCNKMEYFLLFTFDKFCTTVQGLWLKIHKNPNLIGISSNSLHNIKHVCITFKKYKNREFSPINF